MPGFTVKGVDRESGFDTELTVHADTADNARIKAELKGVVVTAVTEPGGEAEGTRQAGSLPVAPALPQRTPPRKQVSGAALGFGIGSIVFGSIALLASIFPLIGCLALPLALFGFGLGFIGILIALTRGRGGSVIPGAGTTICAVALVLILIQMFLVGSAVTAIMTAPTGNTKRNRQVRTPRLPAYEIVRDRSYATPAEGKIVWDVQIAPRLAQPDRRRLCEELYKQAVQRLKQHRVPTGVFIYFWEKGVRNMDSGQWVSMVSSTAADSWELEILVDNPNATE